MDSSSSGGVSRNGVANKVREARTTGPRPFMKTRANVSRSRDRKPAKMHAINEPYALDPRSFRPPSHYGESNRYLDKKESN